MTTKPKNTLPYWILEKSIFYPENNSNTQILLDELWRQRQASLLTFKLRLEAKFPQKDEINTFFKEFNRFISLSIDERRTIIEFPIFRIWFKQVAVISPKLSSLSLAEIHEYAGFLNDFGRIVELVLNPIEENLYIPGTEIALMRYYTDKWVVKVSPPTYIFPSKDEAIELDRNSAYPLEFFASVIEGAFKRIRNTWPLLYSDICRFVGQIIHLDLADFRSCSADRYVGIIFLTGSDISLIDIEESLVHEFGHQILYDIMELDPIIIDDGKLYKLPWSGSERDYYGYFHALYIYTLLVNYFMKIRDRPEEEEIFVTKRIAHILDGCIRAVNDFDKTMSFTSVGMLFYKKLKNQIFFIEKEFNRRSNDKEKS